MKNIEKIVFTIIFMVGLGAYSVFSMIEAQESLVEYANNLNVQTVDDLKNSISDLETNMKDNVAERYSMIEAYGLVSKLLGKNEVNGFEYVRDKNGFLSLGNFWNEVYDIDEKALAVDVKRFNDMLQEKDIPMLFVAFPQKVSDEWTDGYSGIPYDDFSYEVNQFMIQTRKYRVPNVDLTKTLEETGYSYEDMFFRTDHHWTSKAAFAGFVSIVDKIEDMGIDIDPKGYYRNLDNYEQIHYEDMMLGSSGRSVGLIYSGGLDDFDLYYLKDGSEYEYSLSSDEVIRGNIEETLIDFNIPEDINNKKYAIYSRSMYDMYMRGIRSRMSIKNTTKEDGLKVLMVSDSYASPIGVWLAPMCSEVDYLWANHNSREDIERYIDENEYDLVIVGLYPNDMNPDFIHFMPEIEIETTDENEETEEVTAG